MQPLILKEPSVKPLTKGEPDALAQCASGLRRPCRAFNVGWGTKEEGRGPKQAEQTCLPLSQVSPGVAIAQPDVKLKEKQILAPSFVVVGRSPNSAGALTPRRHLPLSLPFPFPLSFVSWQLLPSLRLLLLSSSILILFSKSLMLGPEVGAEEELVPPPPLGREARTAATA